MNLEIRTTKFPDALLITPRVYSDSRGYFYESYKTSAYAELGLPTEWLQDNQSMSHKGVLRGLHWQNPPYAQAKLVRVVRGSVFDVIVDLRPDSPSFMQYQGFILSEANNHQLYVPEGFAHGFLSLEDNTHFVYKCSREYSKASEAGIHYSDPDINIEWPDIAVQPIVSEKDDELPFIKDALL